MPPSTALQHVSQVLTCLVYQHAHFEENVAPPKLVPAVPIPDEVSIRVRRLFPEEVTSELARLRRWLPSFADGEKGTWGDVADCLVNAIDALPVGAVSARTRCELFANTVLIDAVASAEDGDVGNSRLRDARVESRHAKLLLDQNSMATVKTLVEAGYVMPCATALLQVLNNNNGTGGAWETNMQWLSQSAAWAWSGDGSVSAGANACDAAVVVFQFVLDEMVTPATHGAQRRPLALALATIMKQIGKGGACATDIGKLPIMALTELGEKWSEKKNAAAENSALLQSAAALRRRISGGAETDPDVEKLDVAVYDALCFGLTAEKAESKESALECLVDYLSSSRAPTRELLRRAASVGGNKGPPQHTWVLVQQVLTSAARADPKLALDVACEMLKSTGAPAEPYAARDPHANTPHKSIFGTAKAVGTGVKPVNSVLGAGTAKSRVVALRFLSWVLGTDETRVERDESDDDHHKKRSVQNASEEQERLRAAEELRRRAPSLAAAVANALRPKPPSGTWLGSGASAPVTYLATTPSPDAPYGDDVAVMLTALRCSPLLLNPVFFLGKGTHRDLVGEEQNFLAVALASQCGDATVEAAARRAIRRHVQHVSPTVLRRAVVISLRAAESAIEGSIDAGEWVCRLQTAAVCVAEAAARPTEDVFFDAAAVGPRAATAVLLASAHPNQSVHFAAASLLLAAEDLVDVASLSGDALGHGRDALEDAETSLASKLGGGLLKWLSSQASVGAETRDRAVSMFGGWNDDERVISWRGGELNASSDAGVRRVLERLAAARVVEYVPKTDGAEHELWKRHVAFYVAAARPVDHVPIKGGSLPLPGQAGTNVSSQNASPSSNQNTSPGNTTARKMLFPEDKPGVTDLGFADGGEHDTEGSLNLEKEVGLDHGVGAFDSAAAHKRVWTRCAAAAEEGGKESFSPTAARSARQRGEALSDALVGAAPPCIAAVVSVVAADVVAAAASTQAVLANELLSGGFVGAKAAKTLWPALGRAACGLGLLTHVASRIVERRSMDAAAFVDDADTPECAAFDDALQLIWAACDAWLPALPEVAKQAYSSDYGDDGVLTDDDGVAAASRAAEAAAALAALRLRVAPPLTTTALDAAMRSLVKSLPEMKGEWRAFANVVLEAVNVVVVAAGAPVPIGTETGTETHTTADDGFGDGPPLTQAVADSALARLAEASRVASRDVEQRTTRSAAHKADGESRTQTHKELRSPLGILGGALQAGALVTAALAELLARTPRRAAAAAAASALQAAGTARAAAAARLDRVEHNTFTTPIVSPTRLLDPLVAAVGVEKPGLVVAASLISLRLSPSLAASASAHRALRAVAGATAGPETAAAAAAAADAADAAASGEDFALAAETRRGAASAVTSAFVNTSRPEATARVEATAEGVFDLAYALARIERSTENGNHPTENDAAIGRRVWCAAAAAAEPAVASSLRACVAAVAAAALETVNALVLEVPAPATRDVATALARATLECAPSASEDAGASFWHTLGGKIVGNLGFEGDYESDKYLDGLEAASDAAAAVVDILVHACAAESGGETIAKREVAALAALRFLRSEAGAAAAPRLVELVELVEGGEHDVASAKTASAAMRLVTAAMACPLASSTFAPWLPSLAASATARRATSPDAASLVAALRIASIAAANADVPNATVASEVASRFPKGVLGFRIAVAECAMRAVETACADGGPEFCASSAEAATRLFEAAVRGGGGVAEIKKSLKSGNAKQKQKPQKPQKPFPTKPLSLYAARLARVFASATGDSRGVPVAVAVADAMAALAERYAAAGHLAAASVNAAVVTRLCVAVSLAAIALPSPLCVTAGTRLAIASGLSSSTRLKTGVAPAVVAALTRANGASLPEAAAAVFSRVLFLPRGGSDLTQDEVPVVPKESTQKPSVYSLEAKDARADILDVACGVLSALPDDDGVSGSLDEFAILTCALLTWPSIGSPPDSHAGEAAVRIVTGLGVEALVPVAETFAALARGEYGDAPEDPLNETNETNAPHSPSPHKKTGVLRTKHRKNRRVFFKRATTAMAEAGCTSPTAWANALRALAAAAAAAKTDKDARLAACDLLCAWLDARVASEGKGAWETKALAAAASELVAMDDAAVAPACSALVSTEVTAEPHAVVDAVLLGDVTPHADVWESEDVKIRLAKWDPPVSSVLRAVGETVGKTVVSKTTTDTGIRKTNTHRVRGVSVANENRLRRWASAWLADASTSAESLLAGHKRSQGAAAAAVASPPVSHGSHVPRIDSKLTDHRKTQIAKQSQSVDPGSGDELLTSASASDAESEELNVFSNSFSNAKQRFVVVGGPLGKQVADFSSISETERVPLKLGDGWGVVDNLFPVVKSPLGTGGKRTLSPALAASSPAGRLKTAMRTSEGTPRSIQSGLGGASPATSRRTRRTARALGVSVDSPLLVSSKGTPGGRESTNPFTRRNSNSPDRVDETDEIMVERLRREGDVFVAGDGHNQGDRDARDGDEGEYDDDDIWDGVKLTYSAANTHKKRTQISGSRPPKSPKGFKFGTLPPAPTSESSVDNLVRGLGEMQAFELDLDDEDSRVSPGTRRQMRDADYKEAARRAKEISATRRAERALVSPGRNPSPSRRRTEGPSL